MRGGRGVSLVFSFQNTARTRNKSLDYCTRIGYITGVGSLVSGYKSKSCNWLHVDSSDIRTFADEKACESSIFSKRLTLRICNIV